MLRGQRGHHSGLPRPMQTTRCPVQVEDSAIERDVSMDESTMMINNDRNNDVDGNGNVNQQEEGAVVPDFASTMGLSSFPEPPPSSSFTQQPPFQSQEQINISACASSEDILRCRCPVVIDGANVALSGSGIHESGSWDHCDISRIRTVVSYYQQKGLRSFAFLPQFWAKRSRQGKWSPFFDIYLFCNIYQVTLASLADRPWDPSQVQKLVKDKLVVLTPPQAHDDHFILGYARERDGFVITNDMFRDHIAKMEDPTEQEQWRQWCSQRVVPYTFVGDEFVPEPSKMSNLVRHVRSHEISGCSNNVHASASVHSVSQSVSRLPSDVQQVRERADISEDKVSTMDIDPVDDNVEVSGASVNLAKPQNVHHASRIVQRSQLQQEMDHLKQQSKASFIDHLRNAEVAPFVVDHVEKIYTHIFQSAQHRIMAKIRVIWRKHARKLGLNSDKLPDNVDNALPSMVLEAATKFMQRYLAILTEQYEDNEVVDAESASSLVWSTDVQKLLDEEAQVTVIKSIEGSS